jgi:hypothetical protein
MRHALLFEIWEHPDENAFEMSRVDEEGDALRPKVWSSSILRHSFRATSLFEAFRMEHAWRGYPGRWQAPDFDDRPFTAEEAADQARYLAVRGQ